MAASEDEFTQFAEAAAGQLLGTAYLLCGDWHTAEDLVQTTLAKVFASWHRIRTRASAPAYARRTLVNTYFVDCRSRRRREVLSGDARGLLGPAVEPSTLELRLELTQALATLPPKARAIVVLRYWEDMSIEQVAAHLGCSTGNVKSQSARSLHKLRQLLDAPLPDADSPAGDHNNNGEGRDGRDATASTV
jgi:RNA polymerase sigma-70 factor (sigma-E family)